MEECEEVQEEVGDRDPVPSCEPVSRMDDKQELGGTSDVVWIRDVSDWSMGVVPKTVEKGFTRGRARKKRANDW